MKAERWKPRKMDITEVLRFQGILQIERELMLRSLDRLVDESRSEDSDGPKDMGDLCTTVLSKEALFRQTADRQRLVRMIDAALVRIGQGTFGVCESCGDDINPRRLDALPWTQYCLRCQQSLEKEGANGLNGARSSVAKKYVALRKAG